MTNMQEIYASYLKQENNVRKLEEKIADKQRQLRRLEKKMQYTSWLDYILHPMAKALVPMLGCTEYEILGPFGLRSETCVRFKKKDSDAKYGDYSLHVTLHCDYNDDSLYKGEYLCRSKKSVTLKYDTGARDNSYEPNSIGELNCFNKIEAVLPDDLNEIVKIIMR